MFKESIKSQAPKLFIFTENWFTWAVSHPVYTFVRHSNVSRRTLNLPVMLTGQTFFTKYLTHFKSVWMIRVWLLLLNIICPFVVFCQNCIHACCVRVQCQPPLVFANYFNLLSDFLMSVSWALIPLSETADQSIYFCLQPAESAERPKSIQFRVYMVQTWTLKAHQIESRPAFSGIQYINIIKCFCANVF